MVYKDLSLQEYIPNKHNVFIKLNLGFVLTGWFKSESWCT